MALYRTPYHNRYDPELLQRVKEISKDTRIPVSKLLDEALKYLVDKYSDLEIINLKGERF